MAQSDEKFERPEVIHRPEIVGGEWRIVDHHGWHFQANDWRNRHIIDRFGHDLTQNMVRRRAKRMGSAYENAYRNAFEEARVSVEAHQWRHIRQVMLEEHVEDRVHVLIAELSQGFNQHVGDMNTEVVEAMTMLPRREFIPRELCTPNFGQWRTRSNPLR